MKADSMRWQTERSHSRGEGNGFAELSLFSYTHSHKPGITSQLFTGNVPLAARLRTHITSALRCNMILPMDQCSPNQDLAACARIQTWVQVRRRIHSADRTLGLTQMNEAAYQLQVSLLSREHLRKPTAIAVREMRLPNQSQLLVGVRGGTVLTVCMVLLGRPQATSSEPVSVDFGTVTIINGSQHPHIHDVTTNKHRRMTMIVDTGGEGAQSMLGPC